MEDSDVVASGCIQPPHELLKLRPVTLAVSVVSRHEQIGVNHLMLIELAEKKKRGIKRRERMISAYDDNRQIFLAAETHQEGFDHFFAAAEFEQRFRQLDHAIASTVILTQASTQCHSFTPLYLHRGETTVEILLVELREVNTLPKRDHTRM